MTSSNGTQTGYAAVSGARLYYEVAGAGHPLVLIHAGIADSTMWDDQFGPFAARYRVVRFDMRGVGRSSKPPEDYTAHDDVCGLLNELGIAQAYLLGCSMGGSAAIDVTLTYPELVDGLVLVGAGVSGAPSFEQGDLAPRWDEIEAAFDAGDLALGTELETRMWVDGPYRPSSAVDPNVRARAYAMGLRVNEQYSKEGKARPLDPPAFERLGEIRAPTLVIVGDQDTPEIQEQADVLAYRIPGARKEVIANTAHLPNMEQPAQFNRLVLTFLDGLSGTHMP